MKFTEIQYQSSLNNEQYTPEYGVEILLEHITHLKGKVIWCPFDKEDSAFVKVLKEEGFNVIHSHIDEGKDYFNYVPGYFDVILSNPPYENKRKFIERAISLQKPFCFLLPISILNDTMVSDLYGDNLELLIPRERMEFRIPPEGRENEKRGRVSFKACYFGYNFFDGKKNNNVKKGRYEKDK